MDNLEIDSREKFEEQSEIEVISRTTRDNEYISEKKDNRHNTHLTYSPDKGYEVHE